MADEAADTNRGSQATGNLTFDQDYPDSSQPYGECGRELRESES